MVLLDLMSRQRAIFTHARASASVMNYELHKVTCKSRKFVHFVSWLEQKLLSLVKLNEGFNLVSKFIQCFLYKLRDTLWTKQAINTMTELFTLKVECANSLLKTIHPHFHFWSRRWDKGKVNIKQSKLFNSFKVLQIEVVPPAKTTHPNMSPFSLCKSVTIKSETHKLKLPSLQRTALTSIH